MYSLDTRYCGIGQNLHNLLYYNNMRNKILKLDIDNTHVYAYNEDKSGAMWGKVVHFLVALTCHNHSPRAKLSGCQHSCTSDGGTLAPIVLCSINLNL